MKNAIITRALACQFIDHVIKIKALEGPISDARLPFACVKFCNEASSSEVRAMLRDGTWRRVDTLATDDHPFPERDHLDRFLCAYF